ncbi:MAG: protoporphyrinogen oxidase, partial [Deltaproteobacteria bacterium CG07_land_8_20_14_0_80_38_7]
MKKVVVIGGGIAGLSLAYSLIKQGFDVTLIEKENRVGGALNTVLKNNKYIIEYGPNTFLSTSDSIANLISDLNLNNQCVTNDKVSKKRYIYKNGKLRLVPKSPSSFISSRLLTTRGKIRALCEPLIRSKTQDT